MSIVYTAGFSTTGSAQSMAYVLNGNQGTIGSGTFAPLTYASAGITGYTGFPAAVKTALDGTGGGPYTVSWSVLTGSYTISRGSNFTLAFSTATVPAAGTRLRRALGFSGDLSGALSYTSDVRPYYVIIPAHDALTNVSNVFEPDDMTEEAVADDGTPYGVSANTTTNLLSDWVQGFESLAATFSTSATAAVPWTWQHFVQHVRVQHPFAVYDTTAGLYRLRMDSAYLKPQRVATDDDTYWNIPFKTRFRGVLT